MGLREWIGRWRERHVSAKPVKDVDTLCVWAVAGRKHKISADDVFRALPDFVPAGSFLRLEGTSMAEDVRNLLVENSTQTVLDRRPDTIWPRPKVFHVTASDEVLGALAEMCDHHAWPEMCDHLFVYKDDRVLLSWPDFPDDETLWVSELIDEAAVERFFGALGCIPERILSGVAADS